MAAIARRSPGLRALLVLLASVAVAVSACAGATSAPGTTLDVAQTTRGAAAYPAASSASDSAPGGAPVPSAADTGTPADLHVVYTGSLDLVVAELTPALAKARAAVAAAGGYIGASQESNAADRPTATVTYRIPALRWEDTIGALRGLATKVVTEQTQAAEVGSQIVDLEARLRNLRASESALLEIAKGAGKVSDLLEVQAQLTDIRGQIEQLDAQRARLADQVAYGTLVATFRLDVVAVQETTRGWDPGREIDAASAALIGVAQWLGSAAIWLGIVGLPAVVVLLVVLFVLRRLARRFGPKPRDSQPIAGWGDAPGAEPGA